jgi:hypothetical protein
MSFDQEKEYPVLSKKEPNAHQKSIELDLLDDETDAENYKTWRDVRLSKKTIVFSFRVPKKDMQQLKYISDHTGLSLNAICLLGIQAHNRKFLKEFDDVK